jgi:thiosulfate dehydrogenase [quinone] large subunit
MPPVTTPASNTGSSTPTTSSSASSTADLAAPAALTPGRLHGAAVLRIVFGVLWAVDATFKWLPGFIHGQTLGDELGRAVFSFGIWSGAEGFHLPWKQGMTDLGPSVGYIFASLALYYAFSGSTWSLDTKLRPMLGRCGWLSARSAT